MLKLVLNQKSVGERRSKMMVAKPQRRKLPAREEERAKLIRKKRNKHKRRSKILVLRRKWKRNRNKRNPHLHQELFMLNHLPKMWELKTFSQRNKNKKKMKEKFSIKSHHNHHLSKQNLRLKQRHLRKIKRMRKLLLKWLSHKHHSTSKLRDKNKTMKDRF